MQEDAEVLVIMVELDRSSHTCLNFRIRPLEQAGVEQNVILYRESIDKLIAFPISILRSDSVLLPKQFGSL